MESSREMTLVSAHTRSYKQWDLANIHGARHRAPRRFAGKPMLEPISAQRFVVMLRRVDLLRPIVKLFEQEEAARGYWRTAAIAAAIGTPIDGHLVTAAHLFTAPALGSKLDAGRMASGGHLRLLETSSPMTSTVPTKDRVHG